MKFQCSVLFVSFWKVAKKKYCFQDNTFQQDNAPVHRSLLANNFFNGEREVLKWPEYETNLYLNENLRELLAKGYKKPSLFRKISESAGKLKQQGEMMLS